MHHRSKLLALAIVCMAVLSASGAKLAARDTEYDAERDIGVVAEDRTPATAKRNTDLLNAALAATNPRGRFLFADGRTGPIYYPIRFAAKCFYFAGTIQTDTRVGCGSFVGYGTRPYPIPTTHDKLRGMATTFTKIDGAAGKPFFRLRGWAFNIEGIELRGCPYDVDDTGEGPPAGQASAICFEVEGRIRICTGGHTFSKLSIEGFKVGILTAAGYWDGDTFVPDENHAESGIVDSCLFWDCGDCFRSENQQAMYWKFRDVIVGGWGGVGLRHCTLFDIRRGGEVFADGVQLTHLDATLFAVGDFSPNNCQLTCRDLLLDGGSRRLTLFDSTAAPIAVGWFVRVWGHIANENPGQYESDKLVLANRGQRLENVKFDIRGLPAAGFHPVDGWMVPDTRW